jgi:uncharacterized protein YaiI (UPF0178 family)
MSHTRETELRAVDDFDLHVPVSVIEREESQLSSRFATAYRERQMKLWLDADAAPRDVKDVCFRASERLKLETVLVANQRLTLPLGYSFLSCVRVEGGPDVADDYIAEHADKGDVVVTADIPLAAILVPKGVTVIDPRGEEYTAEIIGERLSVRNFMDSLRSSGVETGGHAPYGSREKQAFANALDRVLTRAIRSG